MNGSRMVRAFAAAFSLVVVPLAGSSALSAKGFECPVSQIGNGVQAGELSKLLPTGDAYERVSKLNEAVYALRQRGVGAPLIIDALISNYCPIVAGNAALSDDQKKTKLVTFAGRVARLVYSLDGATEIILDVPLAPSVVDAIGIKAGAAGISPEDWVASVAAAAAKAAP